MYGFKTLEKKYGIKVMEDYFRIEHYTNGKQKIIPLFKIYSADGCPWENGLTRKQVKEECEQWSDELIKIKSICKGKENKSESKEFNVG